MEVKKTLTTTEPAAVGTSFVVFINSVIALLVLFGVDLSAAQLAGINVVLVNAVAIVAWWLTRRVVTSPYTLAQSSLPSPESALPPPPVIPPTNG